jgi:cysteine-rich repeat protein
VIVVVATALVAASVSVNATTCGDANRDGHVTVTDGVIALRAVASLGGACDLEPACDVDATGTVTLSDGINVLRAAAGLPNPCDAVPVNCGNGTLEAGEDCELVRMNGVFQQIGGLCGSPTVQSNGCGGYLCRINCQCQPATCGNCLIEEGEGCDDLNTVSGDRCSADCLIECGTAVCEPDEVCSANNCVPSD